MNKSATITGLAVAATAMTASADVLLNVDLSVTNTITISGTSGLSALTTTGSDSAGVYLENFFGAAGDGVAESLVAGDLTNVGNASDGSPNLYRDSGSDFGLNVFSWSPDANVTFTAGTQAFTGSATWTVDAATYADMLAGSTSGNLYFPVDNAADVVGADLLGTYNVVPAPGAMALLGLGGIVAGRRRR